MPNLNTVNVLDFRDMETCNLVALKSYPETPEGNKEAEATFAEWVQAASAEPVTDEQLGDFLDQGHFEVGTGAILLTHST